MRRSPLRSRLPARCVCRAGRTLQCAGRHGRQSNPWRRRASGRYRECRPPAGCCARPKALLHRAEWLSCRPTQCPPDSSTGLGNRPLHRVPARCKPRKRSAAKIKLPVSIETISRRSIPAAAISLARLSMRAAIVSAEKTTSISSPRRSASVMRQVCQYCKYAYFIPDRRRQGEAVRGCNLLTSPPHSSAIDPFPFLSHKGDTGRAISATVQRVQ